MSRKQCRHTRRRHAICDNLARLRPEHDLKWGQVGAQLEHPAPLPRCLCIPYSQLKIQDPFRCCALAKNALGIN